MNNFIYRHRLKRLAKITPENAARCEGGLAEQRNQLRSRIRAWEVMLPIFMPGLPQYLKKVPSSINSDPQTSKFPENDKIWVPSLIPKSHRASVCNPTLSDVEDKYRTSQCNDSLAMLHHVLKIKARLVYFKNKNSRGQQEGTRSRAVIDRVHMRVRIAVDKYQHARNAKSDLIGEGSWGTSLRILADEDI